MQTIKTERGTYKISDSRDAGEFMRKLAKPAKRKRIEKMSVRHFPAFIPGDTSAMHYVRKYFELNGWSMESYHALFPKLSPMPAACYDPTTPLVEISHEQ